MIRFYDTNLSYHFEEPMTVYTRCPHCGAETRIRAGRIGRHPAPTARDQGLAWADIAGWEPCRGSGQEPQVNAADPATAQGDRVTG